MYISDDLRDWLIDIVQSSLFQQVAPVFVLFFVPGLVLLATTSIHPTRFFYRLIMGMEGLGFSIPWVFSSSSKASAVASPRKSTHDKKSRKHIRTRAEQLAQNGTAQHDKSNEDEGYYPGLVNISGTYCFMNSTLQALASLAYLHPHIDAINAKAEALDVPTPVIDTLKDLLRRLNQPRSSYHSIRPTEIIQVLASQTEGRTNSLFYSREHQDAQELFQVISECIKNEITTVDKEAYRDRGLGGLANVSPETMSDIGKSVFDGLTANRRSCVFCGYTEAVMHFALDNWQLSLPRLASVCRLEDCLEDYTRLEVLKDCVCRKCSILATHKRLQQDILSLEHDTRPDLKPSNSKKERLKKVRRMEARVRAAIEQERIEDDLKDVRIEKVMSPASTKQAMIARPPPVLALHINRSIHYGHYAAKNNVRLIFPEVLDLTPYTTSGNLSTVPTSAISTPPPALPRSTTPTPATYASPRIIYRLTAVVCHYGQHSFGHYICYRRKPRPSNLVAEKRWAPPKLIDPLRVEDDSTDSGSTIPRYIFEDSAESRPGKGWLRISDDAVKECGIETVLQEGTGAFMLYYEQAVHEYPGVYSSGNGSPRGSEETLRPELRTVGLNGSATSLVSEVGVGVKHPQSAHMSTSATASMKIDTRKGTPKVGLSASFSSSQSSIPGARIVRNVTSGRRSRSVAPRSLEGTPKREINGHANGSYYDLSTSTPLLVQPSTLTKPASRLGSSTSSLASSLPRIPLSQSHLPPNITPSVV